MNVMRTALLLSGAARTIDDCASNILEFIENSEVDVYCFFWDDDLDYEKKKNILSLLKPKQYEFRKTYDFEPLSKRMKEESAVKGREWTIETLYHRALAIHRCFEMCWLITRIEDIKYDAFVFSRSDVKYSNKLDIALALEKFTDKEKEIIIPLQANYNGWSDQFAMAAHHSVAASYAVMIWWMIDEWPDTDIAFHGETLVMNYLRSRNISRIDFDLVYRIIRRSYVGMNVEDVPFDTDRSVDKNAGWL